MSGIIIDLCHNNNHGDPTDRLMAVHVRGADDDMALELEPRFSEDIEGIKFFMGDLLMGCGIIEIHGCIVKFRLAGTWVGNVMWNRYEMMADYALGFIRALQLSKQWNATSGWSEVFDKFNHGEEITGKDLGLDENVRPRVVAPNQLQIAY